MNEKVYSTIKLFVFFCFQNSLKIESFCIFILSFWRIVVSNYLQQINRETWFSVEEIFIFISPEVIIKKHSIQLKTV